MDKNDDDINSIKSKIIYSVTAILKIPRQKPCDCLGESRQPQKGAYSNNIDEQAYYKPVGLPEYSPFQS